MNQPSKEYVYKSGHVSQKYTASLWMEVRPPAPRPSRLPLAQALTVRFASRAADWSDCGVSRDVVPKLLQLASTDPVTNTVPRCKSRASMCINLLGFKGVLY